MLSGMSKNLLPPHPAVIATREALAKRPRPSLEQVMAQAAAGRRLRFGGSSSGQKPQEK